MRPRLALLTLAVLAAGCSERERLNPFDPNNPSTGGRPQDFAAYADQRSVVLQWSPGSAPQLLGYQLSRRGPADTAFTTLYGLIPFGVDSVADAPLTNGSTYTYRLHFVFVQGLGPRYSEDSATPGPLRPWLLELDQGALHRLSADGRRTRRLIPGHDSPNRLALDPASGRVWVADTFNGRLALYEPDGTRVRFIPDFGYPTAMAVDPGDGTLWVCDELRNELCHVDEFGTPVGLVPTIPGLLQPTGVAVDPTDRSAWVCERLGGRVHKFSRDGVRQFMVPVTGPTRVAVDSLTGEAWVTDTQGGRLHRISPGGTVLQSVGGLGQPWGVAVDPRRGRAWVALEAQDAVAVYGRNMSELWRATGVPSPTHLALDLAAGEAWVVGATTLWRLPNGGGAVLRRGGLGLPVDLVLDRAP